MYPDTELAIVVWANGDEVEYPLREVLRLRDEHDLVTFAYRRHYQPVFVEKVDGSRDHPGPLRKMVKDRGVTGGRYGVPFTPNGHHAQFMLIRA